MGGYFTSQRNTSIRTEPESEQVCSGTQAPVPGPPGGRQRMLALRGWPASCCARSVIPTGPGLSAQRWLGRAGLASSGGVGRGRHEPSQSRLSFGEHLCPEARGPNLPLEPAARPCTCSRVSCLKSHTCIHFALSSWRSKRAKATLFAQYHMLLGVWTLVFSPDGFFFIYVNKPVWEAHAPCVWEPNYSDVLTGSLERP